MTLGDFIESIGFIPNNIGTGMIYKFDDGEITKSKYEYDVSNYLRNNSIPYVRNIRYDSIIPYYIGNKDCDYLIDSKWYVEVAGLIEHKKYKLDLDEKIKMLESEKLNYVIVYPSDFKEKSLEEIFSFLCLQIN
jgi:hypothetical protein